MREHEGWQSGQAPDAPAAQPWAGTASAWAGTAPVSQPTNDRPRYDQSTAADTPTTEAAPGVPAAADTAAAAGGAPTVAGGSTVPGGAPVVAGDPAGPSARKPRRLRTALVAVLAAMALAGGSAGVGAVIALQLQPDQVRLSGTVVRDASRPGGTVQLSEVASAVLPAVVTISTGSGAGSGVVISTDGAILTNNHVVDTARGDTVQVTFSDGRTVNGEVVGGDAANDLAVVKVAGVANLTALPFGDSDGVRVGDPVLAVGSPLGLDGSVTSGIVSAVGRDIQAGESRSRSGTSISGALQTDAAINPGNSGGALVNTAGDLIGINTAIATSGSGSGNIGVGFAISSNTAKDVAQRLLNS